MSIPVSIDPLGTLGGVQWYNWAAAKWMSIYGATAYSSEYIITDFIPVSPGALTYAGVGVNAGTYAESLVLIVYAANGTYLDYFNGGIERTSNIGARAAYVRLQTTRAKYKNAYIVQKGVYLFRGEDNPPKPL